MAFNSSIDIKETLKRIQGDRYMQLRSSCIKPERVSTVNLLQYVKIRKKYDD